MARISPPPYTNALIMSDNKISHAWAKWITEAYQALKNTDIQLITSHEVDSESEVSFSSGINNTYSAYLIELTNIVTTSSNEQLKLVTSRDSGVTWDNASSDYSWIYKLRDVTGTTVAESTVGDDTDSSISLTPADISNASTSSLSGTIKIHYPTNELTYKAVSSELIYTDSDSRLQLITCTGRINQTSAVNAFKIQCTTNRIISGTISLYGRL